MQPDMGDDASDRAGDVAGDGKWLSYEELAAIRQISRRAAVRMTQRHRLRRQPGNDGKMRVWVSGDMLAPTVRTLQRDDIGDDARDRAGVMSVHTRALAVLEETVTGLMQRAEAAEARSDAALAVADRTLAQLADAGARADHLQRDLTAAMAAMDMARSEAREAQERAQASDTLRERLDHAERDLAVAQHDAQAAQEAAAALRLAEVARKARGLPARLWGALRGQ